LLKTIHILIILAHCLASQAQTAFIEKLNEELKDQPVDSTFHLIDEHYNYLDSTQAPVQEKIELLYLRVQISDSIGDKIESLYGYQQLSDYGKYMPAEDYYQVLRKMGNRQSNLGNLDEALKAYFTAVTLADSLGNDTLLAEVYRTIGIKYKNAENSILAIKYLNESLAISMNLSDSLGILNACMTMGNAYKNISNYDSALYYYDRSLTISNLTDYPRGAAGNYNNIGNVYLRQDSFDVALDYFFLALEINQSEKNEKWVSYNYNNIGNAFYKIEKYDQAIIYLNKSIAIKDRLNDQEGKVQSLLWLSEVYEKKGNHRLAYKNLLEHVELKGSFQDAERLKMADELEARFQNEKKEAQINALEAEQSLQQVVIASQTKDLEHQEELRAKEANLIYALGFIMLSLLVTIIVFWRNNRQKKKYNEQLETKNSEINKANREIEEARVNLERKNKEVTDSINYAKRIQAAILPSEKTLETHLNEAFVLYMPKDIVAGDFYWTERVADTLLFAVADCTGHGVPGAMVSVICHNALNSCINQLGLTDPGEILDETTQLVLKQFEKSEQEVRDGMDIALCSFNIKTRELKFSGANTPLWVVRNEEVIKYKATRQPVGNHTTRVNFDTHIIPIQKGDWLYMSSDGYSDQFGGDRGKKFLNKRFRELLLSISKKSIKEQSNHLKTTFEDWKQDYEQVDDVCVMGARVD
jgi:serine phosphatase RsbU (regulator of sigma subunit)